MFRNSGPLIAMLTIVSSLKDFFRPGMLVPNAPRGWEGFAPAIPPLPPTKKEWKQRPIEECSEPLVALGPFSDYPQIFTDGVYFGERIDSSPYGLGELPGALVTSFVREGVAGRLAQVAASLPPGYAVMVQDTYRTLEVQKSLFEYQVAKMMREDLMDRDTAEEQAQKFVSKPSSDPTRPSPHNTGGSVDLTLIKFSDAAWKKLMRLNEELQSQDWKVAYRAEMQRQQVLRQESEAVPMGTMFDEVSAATPMRHFEDLAALRKLSDYEQECLINRRLLFNAMTAAGFSAYEEEPWHYDFGNQFDAIRKGGSAIYGQAALSENNLRHETMRRAHFDGNLWEHNAEVQPDLTGPPAELEIRSFVRDTALATGSIVRSRHPLAHKL